MPQKRRWNTRCKEFARKAWDINSSQSSCEEEQRIGQKVVNGEVQRKASLFNSLLHGFTLRFFNQGTDSLPPRVAPGQNRIRGLGIQVVLTR